MSVSVLTKIVHTCDSIWHVSTFSCVNVSRLCDKNGNEEEKKK